MAREAIGNPAPSPGLRAALEAAEAVRGLTSPNPWVGAAIMSEGRIVATGATEPPPGRHAERVALERAGALARGATLYCTLEPCAPFEGKRTPPCCELIVEAGLARVVIAQADPDSRVEHRGIAHLRDRGVTVEVGDGASEAMRQLRPYLKHRETGMPYVVAKFAATLDGRVATASGDSKWITGEAARERVHDERARVDAIIAGSGTVLADDPALTARPGGVTAARQPLRVILDGRGRVPAGSRVLREPGAAIVATTDASTMDWRQSITETGAEVVVLERDGSGVNLHQLLQALGRRGVVTAWIEGGPTLLGTLFDEDLVDECWAFIAPKVVGGGGLAAIGGAGAATVSGAPNLREVEVERYGNDVLIRGYAGSWQPRS